MLTNAAASSGFSPHHHNQIFNSTSTPHQNWLQTNGFQPPLMRPSWIFYIFKVYYYIRKTKMNLWNPHMFLVISLIIGLYFAYFPLNPLVNLGEQKKLMEIFFPPSVTKIILYIIVGYMGNWISLWFEMFWLKRLRRDLSMSCLLLFLLNTFIKILKHYFFICYLHLSTYMFSPNLFCYSSFISIQLMFS